MGLLLLILLGFLASLIGGLYLLGGFRQREKGEPPLDKGVIPWLGHFLSYRENPFNLMEKMKQKHGDVFTVLVAGKYITCVQDPMSFWAVIKEGREKLDFVEFAADLVTRVFGYECEADDHRLLQMASKKHLMGDGLKELCEANLGNMQNLMLHNMADQGTWRTPEAGLFAYTYNTVFRSSYLSLFGNAPHKSEGSEEKAKENDRAATEAVFLEFRKYEKLFPSVVTGLPSPKERSDAKRLIEYFCDRLSVQIKINENINGWVFDQVQIKEANGMDKAMTAKFMFMLLFVSHSNTSNPAFWLLLFLLKQPEAMAAVREEMERVLKESGQEVKRGGPLINLTNEMLKKTTILDSALEETLRLRTAPTITRVVVQDMTLKMEDGREYLFRKGDIVIMFPYAAIQVNPEIHSDPHSFKYDRFLNPDGSKKNTFYMGGKKVRYYNMPWGAGSTLCPGRFFAMAIVKQFVFLILAYFDIELKNPDEDIPGIDVKRLGFGSLQPEQDIQFRYKLRV